MKSSRSKHILQPLLKTQDEKDSALAESNKSNKKLDIPENTVDCREVFTSSPLPQEAENIRHDIPEVSKEVFVTSDTSNKYYQLSSQEPACCNETPSVFPDNQSNTKQLYISECSIKDNQLLALRPSNKDPSNEELTFVLKTPSSFENYPAVSFADLPLIPNCLTPVPSPLNSHSHCHDTFCPIHDHEHSHDDLHNQSTTTTNTFNTPNDHSAEEIAVPPKKRTKKRLRRISEWSDVKRKCLKNIGNRFVTKKGKIVDEKIMGPPCNCKYLCYEKISHFQRYNCFQKFWRLGSREKQWAFVLNYSNKEIKNLNRGKPNKRQYTFKYFLPISIPDLSQSQNETVNVCKTMFLSTLSVSGKIIRTAWEKYDGAIIEEDQRGRHSNHKHLIQPDTIKSVCDHVNSFIPVDSHMFKTSTKLFLDSNLSVSKMFRLYKEWFDDSIYSSKATERQYRDIVSTNFNIGFIPNKRSV